MPSWQFYSDLTDSDTLLTGVYFLCFSHTHLPLPFACSFLALTRLPSCLCIYSCGPLIPGAGWELSGVCRRWRLGWADVSSLIKYHKVRVPRGLRWSSPLVYRACLKPGLAFQQLLQFHGIRPVVYSLCHWCKFHRRKLMVLWQSYGHPADTDAALEEQCLQMWTFLKMIAEPSLSSPFSFDSCCSSSLQKCWM